MKVICISGKAQHGKTTTAHIIKSYLEQKGNKVLIANYAGLVKYVCKEFFGWDGKKDDKGRALLQYVGTDVVRENDPDYWVNFIIDMFNFFSDRWDYAILDDCRFPNEITELSRAGFDTYHIRIRRDNFDTPLNDKAQAHPSEHALDKFIPDFEIENKGTLTDLRETTEEVTKWITGELTAEVYAELRKSLNRFFDVLMDKLAPNDVISFLKSSTRELGK